MKAARQKSIGYRVCDSIPYKILWLVFPGQVLEKMVFLMSTSWPPGPQAEHRVVPRMGVSIAGTSGSSLTARHSSASCCSRVRPRVLAVAFRPSEVRGASCSVPPHCTPSVTLILPNSLPSVSQPLLALADLGACVRPSAWTALPFYPVIRVSIQESAPQRGLL